MREWERLASGAYASGPYELRKDPIKSTWWVFHRNRFVAGCNTLAAAKARAETHNRMSKEQAK